MQNSLPEVKPQGQLIFWQPEAVEVRLRIGLVPDEGMGQIQIEVVRAEDDTLIAMSSNPSFELGQIEAVLDTWLESLWATVWDHSGPF